MAAGMPALTFGGMIAMSRETLRILLLYGLGALAVILPIAAASLLAQHESLVREKERAGAVAALMLQRADKMVEQGKRALTELAQSPSAEPCSEAKQAVMRALVIRSNMLVDVGYVDGDWLVCSAFGSHPISVGPPTYTSAVGYVIRVGVQHRLAPEARLIVVTDPKTGYSAVMSQSLPLDALPGDSNLTGGVIAATSGRILAVRGSFNPAWWRRIGTATAMTFYDGANVMAWRRSQLGDFAVFVAIGPHVIAQGQRQILLVLMPVGILAATLLGWVVARLARLRTSMPSLLRGALRARREFFLEYQPIVDLNTGEWTGAEALLRWRRPNGELVSPEIFIPIAEGNHLMPLVTETALSLLEQEAGALLRAKPGFHVTLNLSADDLSQSALVGRLRAMIHRMRIAPGNLHVEATERTFLDIGVSRENLRLLRACAIKVAIDDFGTGYSSLSYLHSLEADFLKIDKSFVESIGTQSVTSEVIRHIIELGRVLRLQLVAEGVETAAQAEFLRAQAVQYGQGWLFARPMSMEQLMQRLDLTGSAQAVHFAWDRHA
jgi:sensor c-di-GMP phosphodiesterase-like protein